MITSSEWRHYGYPQPGSRKNWVHSTPVQAYIAQNWGVPISKVHGVVSFYPFSPPPRAESITIKFCLEPLADVGGIEQIIEKANNC
jgi:NADH:ubiquinone oxidoreductase subunit E